MDMGNRARTWVRGAAERASIWASDDAWFWHFEGPDNGGGGLTLLRRRPVRFEDIDKVERLLDQLTSLSPGHEVWIEQDWANISRPGLEGAERRAMLEKMSRGPEPHRSFLSIVGGVPGAVTHWQVMISTKRRDGAGRPWITIRSGVPSTPWSEPMHLEQVARTIEQHTVEMSRREVKKNRALFGPLTSESAAQQAHDAKISDRASRRAVIFGGLSGAVTGIGGTAITLWIGG